MNYTSTQSYWCSQRQLIWPLAAANCTSHYQVGPVSRTAGGYSGDTLTLVCRGKSLTGGQFLHIALLSGTCPPAKTRTKLEHYIKKTSFNPVPREKRLINVSTNH